MSYLQLGGDPWKIKINLYTVQEKFVPYIGARAAFQLITATSLFALFGLTCFVRYGVPCVARRGRFQGEVYQFKTLCFALISYAISSTLEGAEYVFYAADTVVTLQYLWMIIMEYLFQYLGYCATFCIFYRVINWLIERIHKEGKLAHIVKITHWVFFALMCSYTAVAWAVSIYFRVEFVESTDVDKINNWGDIFTYTMSAVEIIWWVASLEVCVWVGYAAFYVYRDQHRAARSAGFFGFLGSFFFLGLCFMWAVVAIRYYIILEDDTSSWSWYGQLAVAILELLFTTTSYLGILLTCMKLAILGDDLDDKEYAPATWSEEEPRPRPGSQQVSRPVSPISNSAEYNSDDKSGYKSTSYEAYRDDKSFPMEMDASHPFFEVEGSTQPVVEMEGSSRQVVEAYSGAYVFPKDREDYK